MESIQGDMPNVSSSETASIESLESQSITPPTPPPRSEPPSSAPRSDLLQCKTLTLSNIKTPIAFRPKDEWLIDPIFKQQEYLLPIHNFHPKLILDCGANIGTAAVYFANVYPEAKIISVEPESDNFRMLTYNTVLYYNIERIQGAVWHTDGYVNLLTEGRHPSAFMTTEHEADTPIDANDPNVVRAITVKTLLKQSGRNVIDLLKIDIEGAEKEIFSAPDVDEWLSRTQVIAIELHDRMKRGCSKAVFGAIARYDFYFAQRGENLFFIREQTIN